MEEYIENNEKELSLTLVSNVRDIIFETMGMMQYQDIHRQKIERVINIMRDISNTMNNALNDTDIVCANSAKHIAGDNTDNLVDSDDIDALILQMQD